MRSDERNERLHFLSSLLRSFWNSYWMTYALPKMMKKAPWFWISIPLPSRWCLPRVPWTSRWIFPDDSYFLGIALRGSRCFRNKILRGWRDSFFCVFPYMNKGNDEREFCEAAFLAESSMSEVFGWNWRLTRWNPAVLHTPPIVLSFIYRNITVRMIWSTWIHFLLIATLFPIYTGPIHGKILILTLPYRPFLKPVALKLYRSWKNLAKLWDNHFPECLR
jgi:hypothetical protein